jgi:hypothetical protein
MTITTSIPYQPSVNLLHWSCSDVWLLLCGYDGSADLRAAIPSQDTSYTYMVDKLALDIGVDVMLTYVEKDVVR